MPTMSFALVGLLATATQVFGENPGQRSTDTPNPRLRALEAIQSSEAAGSAKNPYARLFRAPDIAKQLEPGSESAEQDGRKRPTPPEVICGLLVSRVDASQDPRIIVPVPEPRVEAKIRRITPEVCLDRTPPKR